MTENPRSYVLNSMGTGKTRCALWAFDYLKKLGLVNKMLVVCPISTMTFTWAREILLATPHLRWACSMARPTKRLKLLADKKVDVYIVNHDGLAHHRQGDHRPHRHRRDLSSTSWRSTATSPSAPRSSRASSPTRQWSGA